MPDLGTTASGLAVAEEVVKGDDRLDVPDARTGLDGAARAVRLTNGRVLDMTIPALGDLSPKKGMESW